MTIKDVIDLPIESVTNDLDWLDSGFFVPEINYRDLPSHIRGDCERVKLLNHKLFYFDFRRLWQLATLHFDDKPVMVIQRAGREGQDYQGRYVIDASLYLEMVRFLRSQYDTIAPNVYSLDYSGDNLTCFYGNSLTDFFERY